MRAIIIGGNSHVVHNIGHVVETEYHSDIDDCQYGSTQLFRTFPPQYTIVGQGPVLYIREHLAMLPPEEECEDPDAVLIEVRRTA